MSFLQNLPSFKPSSFSAVGASPTPKHNARPAVYCPTVQPDDDAPVYIRTENVSVLIRQFEKMTSGVGGAAAAAAAAGAKKRGDGAGGGMEAAEGAEGKRPRLR
mmetsp:Transcript_27725/g.69728  ORF Transcript_27725/g.69728 Transcript_27725/m.69728 type:complete len:104 (+) Transcript_27725:354-665(+)